MTDEVARIAHERAPHRRRRWLIAIVAGVLVLLGGLFLAVRLGVLAPGAQVMIEARTDGLKIGRFGRLKLEGLSGDLWRDFEIDRLILTDEEGVWLEARDVHVVWDYLQLFRRRFDAEEITAENVRLIRRPVMTPKTESQGLPISFDIDRFGARVEMLPAFSYERGVYDLTGALHVGRRNSGQSGEVHAVSQLHAGDRLDARFSFGGRLPLRVDARAHEARGGALAGALGLPADQPFNLAVDARGRTGAGRFSAVAQSGEARPLEAAGQWSNEGAQAQGRVLLTASELTEPMAQALGREASFRLSASRVGLMQDVALTLASENLRLQVTGLVEPRARKTSARGLQVIAETPDAGALAPGPEMGAARYEGELTGGLDNWRLAGDLAVQQVAAGDYALQRIGGPVTIASARDVLGLEARLRGQGGRGDGPLAALLGGAPVAELEATRLADGRLLLERLGVTGRGLKVAARGSRSLTGSLNFRGEAELTNLGAIRPGAEGALNIDWTARQRNVESPWILSADADGRRLTTGFDALDRLLGQSPDLDLAASFRSGQLTVRTAELNGARARMTLEGVVGGPAGLRLQADWRAEGPLGIGPVEIQGAARGSGHVSGRLAAPTMALQAQFDTVDIPRLPLRDTRLDLRLGPTPGGRAGEISVTARSPYGPARARADLGFPPGALRLSNLSLQAGGVSASGDVALRNGAPSAADLQIAVGPGALLQAGQASASLQITGRPGATRTALQMTARDAAPYGTSLVVDQARLRANGPLNRLAYDLEARGDSPRGDWSVRGDGRLSRTASAYTASFSGGGALGEESLRTARPAVFRFGAGARTADLELVTRRGGAVTAQARLTDKAAELRAMVRNLSLTLVNEDLAGRVNATVNLQGRGRRLEGGLNAQLADARARGSDPASGLDARVEGRLTGRALELVATASNEQGLRARADVLLPAEASAAPLRLALRRDRPIRGDVTANGQVRPLWDLLVGGERTLSGEAAISARLGGTLNDPQLRGQATVTEGRFADGVTGLTLTEASLRASFTDDLVDLLEAQASDGRGGSLRGSGRISLLRGGLSNLRVQLQDFQVIDNELATARATGPVTVHRSADGRIAVAGRLRINEAEISPTTLGPPGVVTMDVVEINKPARLQRPTAPTASGPSVALDIDLDAPGRIFVRGRGLDVELALDAHVGGTIADPALRGAARVVRGDYTFAGKRFAFDERGVVYLATDPEDIRLDLTARRDDPSLTAVIRVRGTAARPEINLSSSPALPEDEVLSQVLFGRSASQLSTLEAARLAAALSSLSGGGGFDVLGDLRALTGLDRLSFIGGGGSGLGVAGGKYLSDDVYLEIIGGGRAGPAVQVEWRVTRRISIVSRLTQMGGNDIAVRWRKDYGASKGDNR
ncbi:translocation/assembly module TamB domain-containing protein [Phenylobacterium sp.]|uniref:translocation/assembly module TamB domain-containing protein n=1 Tax=Phenylobacterium sp. TaxID=1871053 RepID=UPI0035ADC91D